MHENLCNVSKSIFVLLKTISLTWLHAIVAICNLKIKDALKDIKASISLLIACVLMVCEFVYTTGILLGIAIRQNEEEFNNEYDIYTSYFKSLYDKIEIHYNKMKSVEEILNIKTYL